MDHSGYTLGVDYEASERGHEAVQVDVLSRA